jgi:small subunit ribosomal protein S9
MATKTPTTKSEKTEAAKAPKKPRATAVKKPVAHHAEKHEVSEKQEAAVEHVVSTTPAIAKGRYIFATGRRKTAIANIRLFEGKGDTVLNKLPLEKYFTYSFFMEEISKPFEVTGLVGKYHFTGHVNGGGPHAQATAVRHGISQALGKLSEEVRKVLKKNGFLTRDDRKKERKKPGLKRARRSPQWAKR